MIFAIDKFFAVTGFINHITSILGGDVFYSNSGFARLFVKK